jgi:peptide-methionine (R)-S-oxide reductase
MKSAFFGGFGLCFPKSFVFANNNENLFNDYSSKIQTDDLPFEKIVKTDAEWRRILTKKQYLITRKGETEAPYSSPLNKIKAKGIFVCVCCDLPMFSSKHKFDSQTGWASFYQPIEKINIQEKIDNSLPEVRTEVLCNRCDAHLGHVFDDGPEPTGLRYCINGVAMKFIKTK